MAESPQPLPRGKANASVRQYDVDWLRVGTMFAVFLFHCSQFFNNWGWHVKNNPPSAPMALFSLLLVQWIMPIFFVISGVSAGFSLGQRSAKAYFRERSTRLLPPLALGILLLAPPQVWVERVTQSGFQGSLLDFIPHFFEGFYGFGGNFAWMGLHLWYVLVLFIFSLLTFPLFRRFQEPVKLRHPAWLFVLALPLMLLEYFLDPRGIGMQGMGGWNLFTYLILLVYGYLFFRGDHFKRSLRQIGPWALGAALLSQAVITVGAMSGMEPSFDLRESYLLFATLRVANSWCWILGLFYLADRFWQAERPALRYWNRALMPFYILHQPVIVLLGYAVRDLSWSLPLKLLVVVGGSFAIIMALYQWVVRPIKPLHPLFGMK